MTESSEKFNTFGKRLTYLINRQNLSKAQVARMAGLTRQTMTLWCKDRVQPRNPKARDIARFLGSSPDWLLDGIGSPPVGEVGVPIRTGEAEADEIKTEEIVIVPRFNVEHACRKAPTLAPSYSADELRVSVSWFQRNVSHSRFDGYELITAKGDSMLPTFENGDFLIIDRKDSRFDRDGCFAFVFHGDLYAKRIQLIPGGILVLSDNSKYRAYEIKDSELPEVSVCGRIVLALHKQNID